MIVRIDILLNNGALQSGLYKFDTDDFRVIVRSVNIYTESESMILECKDESVEIFKTSEIVYMKISEVKDV